MIADDPDPNSAKALVKATQDKNWIVRVAALGRSKFGRHHRNVDVRSEARGPIHSRRHRGAPH